MSSCRQMGQPHSTCDRQGQDRPERQETAYPDRSLQGDEPYRCPHVVSSSFAENPAARFAVILLVHIVMTRSAFPSTYSVSPDKPSSMSALPCWRQPRITPGKVAGDRPA